MDRLWAQVNAALGVNMPTRNMPTHMVEEGGVVVGLNILPPMEAPGPVAEEAGEEVEEVQLPILQLPYSPSLT